LNNGKVIQIDNTGGTINPTAGSDILGTNGTILDLTDGTLNLTGTATGVSVAAANAYTARPLAAQYCHVLMPSSRRFDHRRSVLGTQ
jgi:hypothetical protein